MPFWEAKKETTIGSGNKKKERLNSPYNFRLTRQTQICGVGWLRVAEWKVNVNQVAGAGILQICAGMPWP